ncbi:MAG: hypothetical protein ACRD82_02370, partial [Blastocatellia bacterium]
MLNYLRESLHWMYLAFFKPFTSLKEERKFTRGQAFATLIKIYPVIIAISMLLLVVVGGLVRFAGASFPWGEAFLGLSLGLPLGLTVGLFWGLTAGLFYGIFSGLFSGLSGGLINEVFRGSVSGLIVGAILGLLFGLLVTHGIELFEKREEPESRFWVGIGGGLFFGVLIGLVESRAEVRNYVLAFPIAFSLAYFRVFFLLPYAWQYTRARKAHDSFRLFHNSPVYWDEVMTMPLPYLRDWLVSLVKQDRERGLDEILFVAEERPFQRKAAFSALLVVAEQDLQLINNLNDLAKASYELDVFPNEDKALPIGLNDARRHLNAISTLAFEYQMRLTPTMQLKVLGYLHSELKTFRNVMALTAPPLGTAFQALAVRWLEMVKQAEAIASEQLKFAPLPNAYVAGAPLLPRDFSLLKGRRDIIRAIETFVLNTGQRHVLLLYGRRRTGKSSTLLNLPRLLSSQFEPVYIDCQDAK